MDNTINTKELMQFSGQKSSTVVTMNLRDIEVELIFAKGKEKLEKIICLRFMSHQICPCCDYNHQE